MRRRDRSVTTTTAGNRLRIGLELPYPTTQNTFANCPHIRVNPAVRSHIGAQLAFFNELSETMSRSFQKGLQLNMQLGQTLFAEAASSGQRMPSATERPTDALSAGSSRDAFRQEAERAIKTGAQFQGNLQSSANGAGGKPDGQVSPPNVPGNMQAYNKNPSPLR